MWSFIPGLGTSKENVGTDSTVTEALTDLARSTTEEERQETVATDFLPKAIKFASGLPFVRDLVAGYYCMMDGNTPSGIKAAIVLPLVYFVCPVDAVPDFIPALGFSDDVVAWTAAFQVFGSYIHDDHYRSADALLALDAE